MTVFGAGILLGAFLFGMEVFLKESYRSSIVQPQAVSNERLQQLWASATEVSFEPVKAELKKAESVVRASGTVDVDGASVSSKPAVKPIPSPAAEKAQKERKPVAVSVPLKTALDGERVRVYLTGQKIVESIPLETYVMGVVAAEMPIDFELEALKAQAVAARTYIVRRLSAGEREGKADVLDTVQHQVYMPKNELKNRWTEEARGANLSKLEQAIEETKGLILTYNGKPIEAAFFSTSNGYTENSEDYWEQSLPYLRSVASPWDKGLSPKYEGEVEVTKAGFLRAMGLPAKSKLSIGVKERTDGKRIKEIEINGKTFTGREVRERMGLASSHFEWEIEGDTVKLKTYGLGHGVGMSQWGANGMAIEGKSAADILLHYYTGASLEQASKLPERTAS